MKKLLISFFKMSISYLKAKLGPKSEFSSYIFRLNRCKDCSWNVKKSKRNYCKGCMCPKSILWPDAELRTKANFKYAECPRKRWKE
jgi:hypothetical protein